MKKTVLLFGAATLLLSACQKEELTPNVNPVSHSASPVSAKAPTWGLCCVWMPRIGECPAYPLNCFDEIIITSSNGRSTANFSKLENAVKNKKVKEFFNSEEWKDIFPEDGSWDNNLSKLKSGARTLVQVTNEESGKIFFTAVDPNHPDSDEAEFVFQFKRENK